MRFSFVGNEEGDGIKHGEIPNDDRPGLADELYAVGVQSIVIIRDDGILMYFRDAADQPEGEPE